MSKTVTFEFEDEELMNDFMGYFSDGGGEQGYEPQLEDGTTYARFSYDGDKVIVTRGKN